MVCFRYTLCYTGVHTMAHLTVRVPQALLDLIDDAALASGKTRSGEVQGLLVMTYMVESKPAKSRVEGRLDSLERFTADMDRRLTRLGV